MYSLSRMNDNVQQLLPPMRSLANAADRRWQQRRSLA
jgi:hypothetical protein